MEIKSLSHNVIYAITKIQKHLSIFYNTKILFYIFLYYIINISKEEYNSISLTIRGKGNQIGEEEKESPME